MSRTLLLLLMVTSVSNASTLQYRNGSSGYNLDYNDTRIRLQAYRYDRSVAVKPCNRELIKRFWSESLKEAQNFPVLKEPAEPYVRIDKEVRWLIPAIPRRLVHMREEFLFLQARGEKACSR